jgi:hypothetical protein
MPNLPTPIRAALGLAATAVDEARKLPETLPQAVTTVPLMAVSTAMQASMKVQQHIATLAARGDEVLSQLRGSSAEPPSWATFDDDASANGAGAPADGADDAQSAKAAFDLIDYDNTGFAEGAEDDAGKGRWDAVGVGGTQPQPDPGADLAGTGGAAEDFDVTATPPSAAGPTPPATDLAEAVSAPDPATVRTGRAAAKAAKSGPAKTGPAKASAAKPGPAKTGAAQAGPAKAAPAKAGPAKAGPAKAAKRPGRKEPDHEPLEVAAKKAKPSPTPNPATMAAEILQAHEAAADDE